MGLKRVFIYVIGSFFLLLAGSAAAQNGCTPPQPDPSATFTGTKYLYYSNGKVQSKTSYLNGAMHGEMIAYFENGTISTKRNYREGYLHGITVRYYANGKLQSETVYQYGRLQGAHVEYYESGTISKTSTFYENRYTGEYRSYYENGRLKVTCNYKQGALDGEFYQYHDNGQLDYRLSYSLDAISQNGPAETYYRNGMLKETIEYKGGTKTGNWKKYDEQGKLVEEGTLHRNRIIGMKIEYYPNGNLHKVGSFQRTPEHVNPNDPRLKEFVEQGRQLIFDSQENLLQTDFYFLGKLLRSVYAAADGKNKWKFLFRHYDRYSRADSTKNDPLTEGHQEAGAYLIDNVTGRTGKPLLRKGEGSYFGPYCFVNNVDVVTGDSMICTDDYTTYRNVSFYDVFWNEWSVFETSMKMYSLFSEGGYWLPAEVMAYGKFKKGKKEGQWLEGSFVDSKGRNLNGIGNKDGHFRGSDIDPDHPFGCYATGNYVANKKEGPWKLVAGNVVFEGNYKNDKKEGTWICNSRTVVNKYKDYYLKSEGGYSALSSYFILRGNFKNGLPDSIWTVYEKDAKSLRKEILYDKGKKVGIVNDYYASGQLKMHGTLVADSLVYTYYSPLGDKLSPKNFEESVFCDTRNGKQNGRYYTWDPQGNISSKGFYVDNAQEGDWLMFRGRDTTSLIHYKNGVMEGAFFEHWGEHRIHGTMKRDAKDGLWTDTARGYKKTENHIGGKCYLMEYTEDNVVMVKNGNGIVTEEDKDRYLVNADAYYAQLKKLYYKDGLLTRKTEFYKTGTLKSDTYFSDRGDSLAVYNSPFGGLCVNSGQGSVTEADRQNRIQRIRFYEDGKLQKEEFYDNGIYRYTKVRFLSKFESKPVIKRKITHTPQGEYLVEVTISNLQNLSSFMKLTEAIPAGFSAKAQNSRQARASGSANTLTFIWTTNEDAEVKVSYTLKGKPKDILNPNYISELRFVRNNTEASVFIQNGDIEFVP